MAACVIAITLRVHAVLVASAAGRLVVCGVPLAVIDVKIRRLPDLLTGACLAGIVAALTAAAWWLIVMLLRRARPGWLGSCSRCGSARTSQLRGSFHRRMILAAACLD
jgi:hypothetical protein